MAPLSLKITMELVDRDTDQVVGRIGRQVPSGIVNLPEMNDLVVAADCAILWDQLKIAGDLPGAVKHAYECADPAAERHGDKGPVIFDEDDGPEAACMEARDYTVK